MILGDLFHCLMLNIYYFSDLIEAVVVSGPIFSELSLHYQSGNVHPRGVFVHTVRLYHECSNSALGDELNTESTKSGCALSNGIYIENNFDFGDQDNHRDIDLFMRIKSNIKNHGPTFYTDQNGFQMQRREKFSSLGMNYFDILFPKLNHNHTIWFPSLAI